MALPKTVSSGIKSSCCNCCSSSKTFLQWWPETHAFIPAMYISLSHSIADLVSAIICKALCQELCFAKARMARDRSILVTASGYTWASCRIFKISGQVPQREYMDSNNWQTLCSPPPPQNCAGVVVSRKSPISCKALFHCSAPTMARAVLQYDSPVAAADLVQTTWNILYQKQLTTRGAWKYSQHCLVITLLHKRCILLALSPLPPPLSSRGISSTDCTCKAKTSRQFPCSPAAFNTDWRSSGKISHSS